MGLHGITPKPQALLKRIIIPFSAIILFAAIAFLVHRDVTLWIDEWMLVTIKSYATLTWDYFFVVATQFGGVAAVVVIAAGLSALFALRRQWTRVVLVAAVLGGVALLNVALKLVFERPRPDLWEHLVIEDSFSFPSGHAMASMALALLLVYFVISSQWRSRTKWTVIAGLAVYVLIVGISRVYLGVHYPSDIVAGWIIAAGWVGMIIPIINRYVRA